MDLAERLMTLRKQKGLTQMQLAETLNVSRQAISRWEVGAAIPSIENLKTLGNLYAVSVDYLLNGEADDREAAELVERENHLEEKRLIFAGMIPRRALVTVITVVGILLVLAVCIFVNRQSPVNEAKKPMPISALETDKTVYPVETFDLEW